MLHAKSVGPLFIYFECGPFRRKFEIENSSLNFHFENGVKIDKPGESLHFYGSISLKSIIGGVPGWLS